MDREEEHYREVLHTLCSYKKLCIMTVKKYLYDFENLPAASQQLLPEYKNRLDGLSGLICSNQSFLNEIVNLHKFSPNSHQIKANALLFENIKSMLRQIVRDWSTIGVDERNVCYGEIMAQIKVLFPFSKDMRVLIPGAGLGRLVFELAKAGYIAQGNEFSLLMLFTSELILNMSHINKWTIHPFIFPFSNIKCEEDQFKSVQFPDIQVNQTSGEMSMVAGDFVEIYSKEEEREKWDCVVTCFFLDTAANILEYVKIIYEILKKSGYWINLGPLLYHYEGNDSSMSIEITLEELFIFMERIGFELVKRKDGISCPYVQNPASILQTRYECSLFVMRK
jgi:carnosine N-methyltransferase